MKLLLVFVLSIVTATCLHTQIEIENDLMENTEKEVRKGEEMTRTKYLLSKLPSMRIWRPTIISLKILCIW